MKAGHMVLQHPAHSPHRIVARSREGKTNMLSAAAPALLVALEFVFRLRGGGEGKEGRLCRFRALCSCLFSSPLSPIRFVACRAFTHSLTMHATTQSLEDLLPPPNEKERRRMALAVSCVALLITVVAALLVGFTLGLSHYMDAMAPQGES